MPPYNYRYRWRRRPPWRRRYRWFQRRRPRRTIQRFYRRRYWVRRKKLFKNYKKKLNFIKIKQFQPQKIVKCSVKGDICLFWCGKGRVPHNFSMWSESIVPYREPGGGAWSMIVFSLKALYEEYVRYRAWFTKSNEGLPLVRLLGGTMKFYRTDFVDYVVTWQLCPPFSATRDMFLNSHPSRQLMNKNKIIVTSKWKARHKKPYKKKHFRPPSLYSNKWYFQKDICQNAFLLITTSACSLDQMYLPEDEISNNITLYSLNTDFFQNPNFVTENTTGYSPKLDLYLYGTGNGPIQNRLPKWTELILLANTTTWTDGKLTKNRNDMLKKQNWGNPFTNLHAHPDTRLYYGKLPQASESFTTEANVTELHELYFQCRYNPSADKGTGNTVYFKSTSISNGTISTLPNKEDIVITDFPLWLIFWGWTDYQKKLAVINQINLNYYFVVVSPYIQPKRPTYLFLDWYFVSPKSSGQTPQELSHWHPRYEMQTEVENAFAVSGPAAPKINRSQSIQAQSNYNFRFKWGGCPAPMETITDPCKQDTFPIPNKELGTYEIQNPETPPESYLYFWDERRHQLTSTATKRLKKDSIFTPFISETPALDIQLQPQESEEETEDLQQQLLRLKHKRRKLRHKLQQLMPKKLKLYHTI
uniref:Capsid protein n=1 Tax=Betatorquevirus homini34 TaxID=3052020 RepID=A0AAU8H8K2_9VIRU